jgi:hypothetical protein
MFEKFLIVMQLVLIACQIIFTLLQIGSIKKPNYRAENTIVIIFQ